MTFLYPSFLWALGALSVPIIVHLFNFRKTTRIYFSSNRFLKQVKEASTAKRRLKHFLILASRLLFLFFLVMAFSQPIIPASQQLENQQNIILYLDNSQSMSAQMDDRTRGLDAGKNFINSIVDVFPPDARYKLITNDFAPYSNSFKTKTEVQELITQVRFSPLSRTMSEVMERIQQNRGTRNLEVFWISDFQKSTFGQAPASIDSASNLHLVPVTFGSMSNIFVDTAYLDNPFAAGGEKNVLRVKIRNDGKQDVDQLNVKLTINNIQAAATTVNVPQGGINETSFDIATGLSGLNKARISFNDFPVSFDNEFYLSLNFTDKIQVIEIKGSGSVTPIEKVFGNTQIFNYKGYPVSNFNYSLLAQADLVVVNGLNSMEQSLSMALRNYLNNYGTVFLIPGSKPDAQTLQVFLQLPMLNLTESRDLTELERPDFSDPFFENVFEEKSVALAMPKAVPLLDWGSDRTAILKFKNDKPFLSRFSQTGTLYVIASALETAQTDFFNHALFVPVMYRMAASSKRADNKLYYNLRESFLNLRLDSLRHDEQIKLVGEEEIIPSQRIVGDRALLDIPKFTMNEGFYNVVSGRDTVSLLAFNLDKAESLLDQFDVAEVKTMLGGGDNISIFGTAQAGTFTSEIKERYLGTPLWKYALLLALLFLVTEILLIRFLK